MGPHPVKWPTGVSECMEFPPERILYSVRDFTSALACNLTLDDQLMCDMHDCDGSVAVSERSSTMTVLSTSQRIITNLLVSELLFLLTNHYRNVSILKQDFRIFLYNYLAMRHETKLGCSWRELFLFLFNFYRFGGPGEVHWLNQPI